jgi:hypothetical protein
LNNTLISEIISRTSSRWIEVGGKWSDAIEYVLNEMFEEKPVEYDHHHSITGHNKVHTMGLVLKKPLPTVTEMTYRVECAVSALINWRSDSQPKFGPVSHEQELIDECREALRQLNRAREREK